MQDSNDEPNKTCRFCSVAMAERVCGLETGRAKTAAEDELSPTERRPLESGLPTSLARQTPRARREARADCGCRAHRAGGVAAMFVAARRVWISLNT